MGKVHEEKAQREAGAAYDSAADEVRALRAERDALKRDNAYMGYVVHGPLLPEQEARATKIERDALRADNERLKRVLEQAQCCILDETPDAALIASDQAAPMSIQAALAEREYTRLEMREACRINYNAGATVGADLAAQVAQLRADVAAMGNALADYFDNASDYSTGATVRAIAERQGPAVLTAKDTP